MSLRRWPLLVLVGLGLQLATTPVRADGTLVIAGGHVETDNDTVWQTVVDHAGGRRARIAVIPTANKSPDAAGKRMVEIFRRHGADGFVVPLTTEAGGVIAQSPAWADRVAQASGVWFLGGNQNQIVAAMRDNSGRPTALLEAVWQVYRAGGMVGGSSAGAAIMSTTMFVHALPVGRVLRFGAAPGRNSSPGLGFIGPDWFVDQHFLVRARLPRTLMAAPLMGYTRAIGVDEDTAAVITADHRLQVVGRSAVIALTFPAPRPSDRRVCQNMSGVTLDYLKAGDGLDMATMQPRFINATGAASNAGTVSRPGNNFSKASLISALTGAAAGTPATIRFRHIEFDFYRDSTTQTSTAGSIAGLKVSIACGPGAD